MQSNRSRDAYSIKDLLNIFINKGNLKKGIQRLNIQDLWPKLMGNAVANYTERIELRDHRLIVKLTSSVLREELSYGKEKIKKMFNRELGEELIKDVVLI